MKYTGNFNLRKPEAEDFYNINDMNDNMDIVDEKLQELAETKAETDNVYTKKEIDTLLEGNNALEFNVVDGILTVTYDDGVEEGSEG